MGSNVLLTTACRLLGAELSSRCRVIVILAEAMPGGVSILPTCQMCLLLVLLASEMIPQSRIDEQRNADLDLSGICYRLRIFETE